MWDEIIDAMSPIVCFIIGVFVFPLLILRLIGEYFRDKK